MRNRKKLPMLKAIYEKPTAKIILSGERLSFPFELGTMSTFATSSKYYTRGSRQSNQARKRNRHSNQEEVKLSLFTDNMVLHVENPKDYTHEEEVKSLSCVQLCDPMDCNLPGSSVYGIFYTRILEWVPFPSAGNGWTSD